MSVWLGLAIFLPVLLFCYISYRERLHANTPVNFLQFGSKLDSPNYSATLLASNSGLSGALFLIAFYGYLYGLNVFWWVVLFWASTQFMSQVTLSWVNSVDSDFFENNGTLHEFIQKLFGDQDVVRQAAARLSMFAYIGLLITETVLGYGIIKAFLPVDEGALGSGPTAAVIVFLLLLLVALYCGISGFRGVVQTDEVQLAAMVFMMASIAYYVKSWPLLIALGLWSIIAVVLYFRLRNKIPATVELQKRELKASDIPQIGKYYAPFFLSFIVLGILWYFVAQPENIIDTIPAIFNPTEEAPFKFAILFGLVNILFWLAWWPSAMDQWHRCASTNSAATPQSREMGAAGYMPILYLGLLSLSFLLLGNTVNHSQVTGGGENQLGAFLNLMAADDSLDSSFLIIFVGIGLVAAMVSTMDSYLVVAAQSWVSDIKESANTGRTLYEVEKDSQSHEPFLGALKTSTALMTIAIIIFSGLCIFLFTDISVVIYLVFGSQLIIAGSLLFAFIHKNRRLSSNASAALISSYKSSFIFLIGSGVPSAMTVEYLLRTGAPAIDVGLFSLALGDAYYWVYANPVIASALCFFLLKRKLPLTTSV